MKRWAGKIENTPLWIRTWGSSWAKVRLRDASGSRALVRRLHGTLRVVLRGSRAWEILLQNPYAQRYKARIWVEGPKKIVVVSEQIGSGPVRRVRKRLLPAGGRKIPIPMLTVRLKPKAAFLKLGCSHPRCALRLGGKTYPLTRKERRIRLEGAWKMWGKLSTSGLEFSISAPGFRTRSFTRRLLPGGKLGFGCIKLQRASRK